MPGFDWSLTVPFSVHPARVAIIEALRWIGEPLSAIELEGCFDGHFDISGLSYHLRTLAEHEVLVKTGERQVRGAVQKFYFFPECDSASR